MQAKAVVESFSIEQIVPYFQPIFNLQNQKAIRYECLSRLISADESMYLPSEFLSIVSREQWSAQLTQRMVQMSNAYCSPKGMRWSINMFPSDLRDIALVRWMQNLFIQLNSNLVGLELAYDSVKDHPHLLQNLLEKLPNVHVTIDDVHSFDDKLKEVIVSGVHAVKIRGSIITRFAKTGENKILITEIIRLCNAWNCDLIAEHIEDSNTLEAVSNLGIKYGQGYFLSQPQGRKTNLKQA